jgi:type II pantothenate kinase
LLLLLLLLLLLQGILAANIFDWGAKACVELYTNGTILDIFAEVGGEVSGPQGSVSVVGVHVC